VAAPLGPARPGTVCCRVARPSPHRYNGRMSNLGPSRFFPPAEMADADGIVGFGGKLAPEWLLDAYRHGIFPWPMGPEEMPIPWCSPDPRAVIELDQFHLPRRLRRTCRGGRFTATLDRDFAGAIKGCATAGDRRWQTWLTRPMIRAYLRMFELGHAHSVEVWHEGELAGGLYGVAVAGLFSAESMFHRVRDASKVALVALVEHLRSRGYALLDIQQLTTHTAQFGAREIPRSKYLARLAEALRQPVVF
jgi:leucyl/phenylalanyl-tRNA---protein transferase